MGRGGEAAGLIRGSGWERGGAGVDLGDGGWGRFGGGGVGLGDGGRGCGGGDGGGERTMGGSISKSTLATPVLLSFREYMDAVVVKQSVGKLR